MLPGDESLTTTLTKAAWRARLTASRREVAAEVRETEARALATSIGVGAARWPPSTVCAYVPVGPEPGSLALLDALRSRGHRVLVPVVVGLAPLDWGTYGGAEALRPGPFGLLEPDGPRLGPGTVRAADVALVPALAVDRKGVRLGKGAGHYDRSLALIQPTTQLIAVVRDNELVDELPVEPHDVRMTAVLTPGGGLVALPLP